MKQIFIRPYEAADYQEVAAIHDGARKEAL